MYKAFNYVPAYLVPARELSFEISGRRPIHCQRRTAIANPTKPIRSSPRQFLQALIVRAFPANWRS
jgi:hypothetical protein